MNLTKDEARRVVRAIQHLMDQDKTEIADLILLSKVMHSFTWGERENVITGEELPPRRPPYIPPPMPQPVMAAECTAFPDLSRVIEEAMARR